MQYFTIDFIEKKIQYNLVGKLKKFRRIKVKQKFQKQKPLLQRALEKWT